MIWRGDGLQREPPIREGRFKLGQIVMTPGAKTHVPPSEMMRALRRHSQGDWGDLCDEDRELNDLAVIDGTRLLSAYMTKSGIKFWIITEADRTVTTVLLPEEY